MADTDTLSGIVFDDPVATDYSSSDGDATGPDGRNGNPPEMEGVRQPALSALEARLAELERLNTRYQEQSRGNQQEAQRVAEHNKLLAQQNTELLTVFRDLLKTTPTSGSTGAPSPAASDPAAALQSLGLVKALEKGTIEGDWSDAQRIEAQLPALLATLVPKSPQTPEPMSAKQIQDIVREELTQTANQQETYRRMITSIAQSHPFLTDPKDQLYAEVWQAYDEAARHPFLQTAYGESGARFTVDMPAPAGQGLLSKPMDMRILDRVALEVRARHAAADGRQQEQDRRRSPTLDTTGRQPPSTRTPSMLFTRGEIANMQELLRLGIRGIKTMDEFKKYRWDKGILPEEKQRRLETWRAGKWDG